jgi:AcrR family transcriptional regulator
MSSSQYSETQIRILEATCRLIEARAGHSVRIEDIARAAGVSRQAVYLNFHSRTGLLVAAVHYVDHVLGLAERVKPIYEARNGVEMLDAKIVFWANYVTDIYGIAKAMMAMRQIDEAANIAWKDAMQELYDGVHDAMLRLAQEGSLLPDWSIDEATDFVWALLSITNWEDLTIERGWSKEQYIRRMQMALKHALLKPEVLRDAAAPATLG